MLTTITYVQAIYAVVEQHSRDLTRASQLATQQAKEQVKEKIEVVDKAKIASLEAELARMWLKKENCEQALAKKETTLATTEY